MNFGRSHVNKYDQAKFERTENFAAIIQSHWLKKWTKELNHKNVEMKPSVSI